MADSFKSGQDPFAASAEIPSGVDPFAPAAPAKPTNTFGLTATPGIVEQFAGGAKHAFDRAAAGLQAAAGGIGLPTGEPLAPLVQQGRQFVQQTGPSSTVGQIAGDVAMSAPVALKAFQGLKGALGLKAALAGDVGINAGYGALTADPGERLEGAAWGGGAAAAVPALGASLRALGKGAAHVLGGTTGAGAESVRQAYRDAPGFVENMRGHVAPGDVVEQARTGLQNMRQSMYDSYKSAKGGWASDTTPLSFQPIGKAFDDAVAKFSFKGVPVPGVPEVQGKVQQSLVEWLQRARQDPSFLTVEGLDALKRHLSDIVPSDITNRSGRSFVTEVVDGVKKSIIAQRPEYAAAMKDYWTRSSQLDEISRSLSLGDKATVDTALRKLQSLMRNNAQTNYGQRLTSAERLATEGGQDVLPAVAGQAMNSWTPRGLQGVVASGTGVSSIMNPSHLAALPAMSPRIVGETARATGKVVNADSTRMLVEALRRMLPASTRGLVGGGDADPR